MKKLGAYILFLRKVFTQPENKKNYFKLFLAECQSIGLNSLFIVSIISLFLGAVTCYQTAINFKIDIFIPPYLIGTAVRDIIILEMAPTVISIVLAGKVGSNIAGGLGTMRTTEQIDALEVMGINSASYLVIPKIVAGLLFFPILIILSLFWQLLGAFIATQFTDVLTGNELMYGIRLGYREFNVFFALIKSFVFAFLIITISSYIGYYSKTGSVNVGRSSTQAVTSSTIAVLISDYLLAQVILG